MDTLPSGIHFRFLIPSTVGECSALTHCVLMCYSSKKKLTHRCCVSFCGGSVVTNPPPVQETQVRSVGREDPLGNEMATHSRILAWDIPWTEEPGRLQSMGSPISFLPDPFPFGQPPISSLYLLVLPYFVKFLLLYCCLEST